MKLVSLIKEGGKLFGPDAQRVSTEEMKKVFTEIENAIGGYFKNISLTKSLPQKQDHGDVDVVYVLKQHDVDIKDIVSHLGTRVKRTSRNGDVFSILFASQYIGKTIHVDFIHGKDSESFNTKLQYFSLNDFSGIVGMLSKKYHFKYGSEGFFKRFRDKKGNWHDIPISRNLMDGLKILGWNPSKFNSIETADDIVDFVLSSPMFGSDLVSHESLNQPDKKSYKRPVIKYVVDKLREANKHANITDEDFFFRKYFPKKYSEVQAVKDKIDGDTPIRSRYDGWWIMRKFAVRPGPVLGKVLKHLTKRFGSSLDDMPENEVMDAVKQYFSDNPQKG